MNNMKKSIKDIIKIIGLAIASIAFVVLTVNRIKVLSYKEVGSRSLMFSYDVKTGNVESLGASS